MTDHPRPQSRRATREIHRAIALAALLRRGQPCTAVSLGEGQGLSERTVKRDLQLLRGLGYRIAWSHDERTYTLERQPPRLL